VEEECESSREAEEPYVKHKKYDEKTAMFTFPKSLYHLAREAEET
jgi:hypothetical protein